MAKKKDLTAQIQSGEKSYNCQEFSAFLKSVSLRRNDSPEEQYPADLKDKKIKCTDILQASAIHLQPEIKYIYELSGKFDLKTECDLLEILMKSAIVTILGEIKDN